MNLKLASFALLIVTVAGAPAADQLPADVSRLAEGSQQFLLFTPQTKLHLQPALNLEQSFLQPIAPFRTVQLEDRNVLVYYPTSAVGQYPLATTKQNAPEWLENFQNSFLGFFQRPGEAEMPAAEGGAAEMMPAAEAMMKNEQMDAREKKVFIVGGEPQFFSNFETIPLPLNPINPLFSLQPLQAIRTRSVNPNDAGEPLPIEQDASAQPTLNAVPLEQVAPLLAIEPSARTAALLQDSVPINLLQPALRAVPLQQVVQLNPHGPIVPIPAGIPLQLRSGLAGAIVEEPETPLAGVLADVQVDDAGASARSLNAMPSAMNVAMVESRKSMMDAMKPMKDEPEAIAMPNTLSDDPSVAEAKPAAIAIAGKGGVASASPRATALVGPGGLAVASPHATSLSGDFLDTDDKEDNADAKPKP